MTSAISIHSCTIRVYHFPKTDLIPAPIEFIVTNLHFGSRDATVLSVSSLLVVSVVVGSGLEDVRLAVGQDPGFYVLVESGSVGA